MWDRGKWKNQGLKREPERCWVNAKSAALLKSGLCLA